MRSASEEGSSLCLAPCVAADPVLTLFQGVLCKRIIILAGSSKCVLLAQLGHFYFSAGMLKINPADT